MVHVNRRTKTNKGRVVKRNYKAIFISIMLATVGVASAVYLYQYTHTAKLEKQYEQTQIELQSKIQSLENTKTQLDSTQSDKEILQKQLEDLNKTKQDLEAQLQAKLAEKQRLASIGVQKVAAQSYSLPANQAKAFIYQKESGNNPAAINSIGCRGLGQACPGSKLPCSDSDYACQDAWFTNYMLQRYGSWEKAYQFWIANNWW